MDKRVVRKAGLALSATLVLALTGCGEKEGAETIPVKSPAVSGQAAAGQTDSAPAEITPARSAPASELAIDLADLPNLENHTRNLVELMTQEKFEEVVREFDSTMSSQMPPMKMREVWKSLIGQTGAFGKLEKTQQEEQGGFRLVRATCTFERATLDIKVVFDSSGKVSGLWFVPVEEAPADDRPPYAVTETYSEEEVVVGTPEWPLPGTLTIPVGDGPFPAVVLVHGSGPNDRDESLGPNKPFRDLAWGLASNGVAVLRYEKRTRAHRVPLVGLTVKQEVLDDVVASIGFLQSKPRVDRNRVFVLGHSLGAMLVPRIDQDVKASGTSMAGYILMAPPARPIEQCILNQTIYLAQLDGSASEQESIQIEQVKTAVQKVEGLTAKDTDSLVPILGAPACYWIDLEGFDGPKSAQQTSGPMLILHGSRDYQVTTEDFTRWKEALANRKDVGFKEYPSLNHLFVRGEGPSSPEEYASRGHVEFAVIQDIAAWVKGESPGK